MTTTDLPPPTDTDDSDAPEAPELDALETPADELARTGEGIGVGAGPVVAVVDPRMRERWVEARRIEGRRRLRVVLAIVALASVVGIAYLVANSPLLGADTIRVRGNTSTSAATVRAVAHIADGAPLLFLDEGAVARRVEALPGIASAEVTTELPTTVVITVKERRPVAWVRVPGAAPVALVDGTGRVVRRVAEAPPALLEVVGAGRAVAPGSAMADAASFRAVQALPSALALLAQRFDVHGGSGSLTLRGSPPTAGVVKLGPMTGVAEKGAVALAVLEDLVRRGQRVATLDVSVADNPLTS